MNTLILIAALLTAEPVAAEKLHTEVDAVGWAFAALTSYPEADRPFVRFVYLPPWADPEWIGLVDYAMNSALSQSPILQRGDRHAGGWLLGYNLARFAPDPVQLARLVGVYDSLAVREYRLHIPDVNVAGDGGQSAFLAPHLQAALAVHVADKDKSQRVDVLVARLTDSPGAIYPADFLLEQLLTSARGKYPELRQMDFEVPKFTPYDALLQKRGFFFTASKELRGEKGALLLTSGVTGKSRVVLTTFGLASRLPMAVTFDFRDSKIRPDQQFIRNLIEFEPQSDAAEAFLPMPNGLIEFVLADAEGNITRVAPPDVAADFTKPDGHTKELEMGMSCILCHASENGYKTASNDMEFLLGSDADYFGDEITVNGKALTRDEAVALVVSRYGERIDEPDGVLGRARRDLIRAVDQVTDYEIAADGPTSVQQLGTKLKAVYHDYRYRLIDADRACLELGVRVAPGTGKAMLRQLVPPAAAGEQEDVLIPLLRNGASIKRDDFAAIYGEMARRAVETRATLFKE